VLAWAGPSAVFRSIRVAYRRPDPVDEPLLLTDTVVDKREEAGRHIIDVDVATVAADGPSVRGIVQIELPVRL
jgi:hypothetical protein